MGGGNYDFNSRSARTQTYAKQTRDQTFKQSHVHESMNPRNIRLRESRDNEHNPHTLAIMLGLDITGSMGQIPHMLIQNGLPDMIKKLKEAGVEDPAVLFMGVGDSRCDSGPFQVGQFESDDKLLDKWLETVWLEGNGGGNGGESYLWPWWLAAYHTATDCWEKRGQKGFLFTVGDEPCHPTIEGDEFMRVIGAGERKTTSELYQEASKRWEIYHLCLGSCDAWKDFPRERLVHIDHHNSIPDTIARLVASHTKTKPAPVTSEPKKDTEGDQEKPIML
jgi:hypothetical protein